MTKVKGLVFRSYIGTFKRLRGEDTLARLMDLLPEDLSASLRAGAITTGSWYPAAWLDQVQAASRLACNEGPELVRAVSREAIKDDFRSGVHRLVTVGLAPDWILKWAPKLVSYYYEPGRLVVEEAHAGRAMGRFEAFTGFTRNLWEQSIGGCTGILEIAGAKTVTPKVLAGGNDGDAHMTFAVRWTV